MQPVDHHVQETTDDDAKPKGKKGDDVGRYSEHAEHTTSIAPFIRLPTKNRALARFLVGYSPVSLLISYKKYL